MTTTITRTGTLDVVVPVLDEEHALPGCVRTLRDYLDAELPGRATITIVDNASTDATLAVASGLAAILPGVRVRHLDRRGRGLALRTAWAESDADVVAYMDVDLSTGLDALPALLAPLWAGHSDIAIGSRLAPGARTVRGPRREFVSRPWNAIVRRTHGVPFSDTQCGFKAARADVIGPLVAQVRDDGWFFDTELLLLAAHNGLRVHEVPVDWVEDVDSRVDVTSTALADLRGLLRVGRARATGAAHVPGLPHRPPPTAAHPDAVLAPPRSGLAWQTGWFAVIGVASTLATLGLYALFREFWSPVVANVVALTVTTVLNTEANRRLTFVGHRAPGGRAHLLGLVLYGLYAALTSGALLALHALVPAPTRLTEVAVLLAASAVGTVARFVALRVWVFRKETR